jgi:hypothetical protein
VSEQETPREAGKYRCNECGVTYGWHQMLIRSGIRENCPACLPGHALVATMKRIDTQPEARNGD